MMRINDTDKSFTESLWSPSLLYWVIICKFPYNSIHYPKYGLPSWLSGKGSTYQCRRLKRCGFNPWVRKIPWRRKWQPTPVFWPGKSHGQRSLAGCSPWGLRVRHNLVTKQHPNYTNISNNNYSLNMFSYFPILQQVLIHH